MRIKDAAQLIVRPGLRWIEGYTGVPVASAEAAVMLLAIGQHESRFEYRVQINGPAQGFWQFERIGVKEALKEDWARDAATEIDDIALEGTPGTLYFLIACNDWLALILARALLWRDPALLPNIGDVDRAYEYYVRNWKPGKPRPDDWPEAYALAVQAACLP